MPDNPDRTWRTGLDVYKWWVGDDPNQLSIFDDIKKTARSCGNRDRQRNIYTNIK